MTVKVKMTRAFDGGPLVVIESLGLGQGAELRPQRLRAFAAALMAAADEAERRKLTHRGKPLPDEHRTYGTAARAPPRLPHRGRPRNGSATAKLAVLP